MKTPTEDMAQNMTMAQLVDIWNDLPGVTPVTKFTSRMKGAERIMNQRNVAVAKETEFDEDNDNYDGNDAEFEGTMDSLDLDSDLPSPVKRKKKAKVPKKAKAKIKAKAAPKAKKAASGDGGAKQREVVRLLERVHGATLDELCEKMDWQRHTVRGLVSMLKSKYGHKIESSRNKDKQRVYKIVA